jgi:murein DD-endopeptidase MepM/ murein hydrolase activator NlpD
MVVRDGFRDCSRVSSIHPVPPIRRAAARAAWVCALSLAIALPAIVLAASMTLARTAHAFSLPDDDSKESGTPPVSMPPPWVVSGVERPAAVPTSSAAVLAEYAPVSIDDLPDYRRPDESAPAFGPEPPPSLTVVTRGRLARGQSLGRALREHGIKPSVIHVIDREMRPVFDFRHSRPGDAYRLAQDTDGNVVDFVYTNKPESSYHLSWNGEGYVVSEEPSELQAEAATLSGEIDSSLYQSILNLGERTALANDFADLFAWDIDFSRQAQPGDRFSILYERLYRTTADGERQYVRPGRILAAQYSGHVGDHSVVLFEQDGRERYFRPDGSSIERAFLAAPLKFSRISSRFTKARAHPILKITRPHNGIDYAAAKGTPIWSVADGTVIFRGKAGASGNLVKIRHLNGYISYYAHLSKFAEGLSVGQRVTQKQVIGFVGDTGLATGPHVCFRVQKHGVYVDPQQIASPAGRPISETAWPAFREQRDLRLSDLGHGPLAAADEAL